MKAMIVRRQRGVTLITALLLFFLGIFAGIGMIFRIGPFG